MKSAIESQRAWDLLLGFWNDRFNVPDEKRCNTLITFNDERKDEQCVLDDAHNDGENLKANVPHSDKDGNIAARVISWQTLAQARYFEERPIGEE
jgi:hypothetical protein